MTNTETYNLGPIPKTKIVGPYSKWPREKDRKTHTLTKAGVVVAVAGSGAFVHCAPTLLF